LAACFIADPIVKLIGLGWKSFRANGWNLFDVVVIFGSIATTLAIILGVADFAVRQAQKLFLVCVAFKLMQKLNNLNQLFKTAVYVYSLSTVVTLKLTTSQFEFERHCEVVRIMDQFVPILWNFVAGSLCIDKMGDRRVGQSKLHVAQCYVGYDDFHEFRVRMLL